MFKLLKRLNMHEYQMIFISVIFIALQVWLELKIPDYMSVLTQKLESSGTTTADILAPGLIMLFLSVLSVIASVIVGYFVAKIAAGFAARLRKDSFTQIMNYASQDIKQFSVPSLLTRSTNDITQLQQFVAMGLQAIIKAPITTIWAITKIAGKGWQWTTATGIAVAVLTIMLTLMLLLVQPKFKVVQKLTDNLNQITRENLTGIKVVHAYNAEKYQSDKLDQANSQLTNTNLFAYRVLALMNPGMSLISSTLTLSVYTIGAIVINQAAQAQRLPLFGNMIVFSSYAMQVIMGFLLLSIIFVLLPRVTVSANRLNEILNVEPSIKYPASTRNLQTSTNQKGIIEFKHVGLKYKGAESSALTNLSFKAQQGQTVAFIGSTGSGKSTALQLILRVHDATSGEILIDGKDIQEYSEENLNNKIGYIPQRAVLFSGTVRSNIDLGESQNKHSPLTDTEILTALDIAQAKDFVLQKEKGLDEPVAQHGDNFSGGQKQRLAITRAIARKPEILLFDDSFSALDYATDRKLRDNLAQKFKNVTKIIVAQRISTISDADQIIVLDNGKVVGQGTHEQLLKNNKVYQEIAYSQLSKEELAK
ncbi:ABC transporter ATP-binding protein [Pediococcus siamensis]|uniref:ABC transporter ATP-binding protein n=1 Tax=Pediococcus siamensis TaxID=381829 RepID=UPI00399FA258